MTGVPQPGNLPSSHTCTQGPRVSAIALIATHLPRTANAGGYGSRLALALDNASRCQELAWPGRRERGTAISPIEQLPQHVVHRLAVLLVLWRRVILHRRGLGIRRRSRCGKTATLAAALIQSLAQPLLQQFAQGLAEPAAEHVGQTAAARSAAIRSSTLAAKSSQSTRSEQALAHLLQLGIGRVGIVEHAGHVGIEAPPGQSPGDHGVKS